MGRIVIVEGGVVESAVATCVPPRDLEITGLRRTHEAGGGDEETLTGQTYHRFGY
jgi:hypothetical protein